MQRRQERCGGFSCIFSPLFVGVLCMNTTFVLHGLPLPEMSDQWSTSLIGAWITSLQNLVFCRLLAGGVFSPIGVRNTPPRSPLLLVGKRWFLPTEGSSTWATLDPISFSYGWLKGSPFTFHFYLSSLYGRYKTNLLHVREASSRRMSQLTITLSDKADSLIAQLQKEIFNRRRKKVSAAGVVETLVESGAKSQSDKRYATSWLNLIKDIEKAAKLSNTHGGKPQGLSSDEWALVLSHRNRFSSTGTKQAVKKVAARTKPEKTAKPAKTVRRTRTRASKANSAQAVTVPVTTNWAFPGKRGGPEFPYDFYPGHASCSRFQGSILSSIRKDTYQKRL